MSKRTLFRWLTEKLDCCIEESKPFAGMTPQRAWAKANPYERYTVLRALPAFHHTDRKCPACNPNARANKKLPAIVLTAFRKWQRAKLG